MTPTALFALFASLLVIVVSAFLLPPLWLARKPATTPADRRAANLAIFRDQLAELEREKAEGELADADFEQAKRELQHRLLAEVQPDTQEAASLRPSRKAAVALLVLVPMLSVVGYTILGNPRALEPALTAPRTQVTPQQIEGMVAKLAERLKANPDDMQGWIMLGRSYKAMGRYAEAAEAYGKAERIVLQDPGLLTDYAEAIAMSNQNRMLGKPKELIDRALKLEPENPQALLLAGVAAMQTGKRTEAANYWEKLLPMVEPGSEMETMLKNSIAKLRQPK
ncbi:MAG TPA: c-type cytochrome biogenesis protein CcmI [Rhodocyclaceae bacterium]|nr:c-type cytochrome biogenesis protein CcmI [Rhodocyclaceae bacterium]